jgi:hypothetical protein
MPHPDENLVRSVLLKNDRNKLIRGAIAGAWEAFNERYPERAWWRRKSTRAAVIWEYSVENAIKGMETDQGVKAIPHDDTVSLVFDQKVLLRFKKADMELRSRNYPTALANLFHKHEEQLPGFDNLHRVEAAYVLNQFQTRIDWIGIVARERKRHLWNWEIDAGGVVADFPVQDRKGTAADEVIRRPTLVPLRENENE